MRLPFRRTAHVPPEVTARAPLHEGESVLAAAEARDGSWLLGTRDALLLVPAARTHESPVEPVETPGPAAVESPVEPVETPGPAAVRIPWERVQRADWDQDRRRLRVAEVGEFGHKRPEHVLLVDEPGRLLQLVRERVTASVVLQRRVFVSGKSGFTVIARRPPGRSGEITWAYEFDRGVDPEDPGVMRSAEQALAVAKEELGL